MALNISRGIQKNAQKVVIYGVEGIGKSTLASKFPDPLFIDTEGSTAHLDVARLDPPASWSMLLDQVKEITATKPCKTLIIDTADWAERLCIKHVISQANNPKIKSIEDFGYGQGYTKLVEEFGRLLDLLSATCRAGMNVVLTAHCDIRKFEQPDEAASYDRYELKLSKSGQKKVAPLLKEWADAVLFLNYETIVESVSSGMGASKGKARGGTKRVMYCNHNACWDAKNRWGLPDKVPMGYEQIAQFIPSDAIMAQSVPVAETTPSKNPSPSSNDILKKAMAAQKVHQEIMQEIKEGSVQAVAPLHELEGLPAFWEPALQLMKNAGITVDDIKNVSVTAGNFTADTPVGNYPEEYVSGFIVSNFDKIKDRVEELSVPFN